MLSCRRQIDMAGANFQLRMWKVLVRPTRRAPKPRLSLKALHRELRELRQRVEDLEDLRELNQAIEKTGGAL